MEYQQLSNLISNYDKHSNKQNDDDLSLYMQEGLRKKLLALCLFFLSMQVVKERKGCICTWVPNSNTHIVSFAYLYFDLILSVEVLDRVHSHYMHANVATIPQHHLLELCLWVNY